MIFHFILNPKSGRSPKQRKLEQQIKEACKKRQLNYHIYYTTCAGDATEYVRSMIRISQERQRFICIGGDGTINEIANSAPSTPGVEFGVIPSGSGNDFVRNFTNTKLFSSIEAQLDGEAISLDLIKCNEYYCVNMVNIGFDCAVVKEAERLKRHKFVTPGMSYIMGVVVVLFKKFGTKMKVIFDDGEVIEKEFTLTAIGNGKFCGGGFKSAPKALLNDGLLDVCAIDKISRLTFISLVGSYKKGTYLENQRAMKYIRHRRVPHFKMEFDTPIPICIDGEIKGAKTVDFEVVKNAFNFVVPKGCALKYTE
ncbi:MAG: diacylglycerol kinase family lipid kinase [Clostridia bacterium]|nr:diacylglycerol kinase family lipid kinase [Clostridia bacterium]